MRMKNVELRCATYKFSEQTRERIERIKHDRAKAENVLFGFATELRNTDVLRFLIDQEIMHIEQRAEAARAQEQAEQRRQCKTIAQRQRRALKKGGTK